MSTIHRNEGSCAVGQAVPTTALDQLARFSRASVLHIGAVEWAILAALAVDPRRVVQIDAQVATTLQLDQRFDLIVVGPNVLSGNDHGHDRAVMHAALQHADRGGHLVVLGDTPQPHGVGCFWPSELSVVGSYPLAATSLTLYRRGDRTTVHDLLFEARATIARVSPGRLAERIRAADGTLVLDTRTHTDRERFGVIPGAIHVPRTVVEWHLDPANGYLHPVMRSFDQPLVLVCNGGYSSSLAAANLVRLGFSDVADLIGGHTAWAAAGLPIVPPDHSHVETPRIDDPVRNGWANAPAGTQ